MIFRAGILIGLVTASYGQAQSGPAMEFEVASIRLHTGLLTVSGGIHISGARVSIPASSLSALIASAYGLKDYQLEGLAEWMQSDLFDVSAEAPAGTAPTADQAKWMLQALLAERFQLKMHPETKEKPVYALTVVKSGPKLKENPSGPGITKFNRKGLDVEMVFVGTPISSLIRQLPRIPGIDRPVLDETDLRGKYDLTFSLADVQLGMKVEQNGIPAADSESASVFTALQDQLGLKLEPRQAPVPVFVIDRAERPSEN
jgi:uncharacterized protein (TIGR03435 family)